MTNTGYTREMGNQGRVENFALAPKCGAKNRQGQPCQKNAMANGRCANHGGKSLSGIASPAYKGKGRTKKYLPPVNILEAYVNAVDNPELLNLTEEAALFSARMQELLGKLSTNDSKGRWKLLKEQWALLKKAQQGGDAFGVADAIKELNKLISGADMDFLVWDDIIKVNKELRATIAQEQKRRMDMNALISTEDAVGFLSEALLVVRNNVSDPKELNAIYTEIQAVMTRRPGMMTAMSQPQDDDAEGVEWSDDGEE